MVNFAESKRLLLDKHLYLKKNGLEHVKKVLSKLGDPQNGLKCVHVAGTNGKGSVCAAFESVLAESGYKVGVFTSPHLVDITERIKINRIKVSEEDFAGLFKAVSKADDGLSFFETLTCMSLLYFQRERVDIAVMEVGIGGKYDTTNVIDPPPVCVISSVGIDHTGYLGDGEVSIARQKAGIIKKGSVCVCPKMKKTVMDAISREASAAGGRLSVVSDFFGICEKNWDEGRMVLSGRGGTYPFNCAGDFQAVNASCVWEGLRELKSAGLGKINEESVKKGFAKINLRGRFQILPRNAPALSKTAFGLPCAETARKGGVYVIDGLHNPAAAVSFAESFEKSPFFGSDLCLVCSIMKDKDYASILKTFSRLVKNVCFTKTGSSRAASPTLLADTMAKINPLADIEVNEDVSDALASASKFKNVVVAGSFYLAGAALEILGEE